MQKIKKGDNVLVIAGKDKGKKGEVLKCFSKREKAIVKGVNLVRKSVKKSKENPKGGFVEIEKPIHISNLMFFCPKCGKGVRVGISVEKDKKFRVCKKCGNKFD